MQTPDPDPSSSPAPRPRRFSNRGEGLLFTLAIIATPVLGVGLAVVSSASADQTPYTQQALQRDLDAVVATGATGVQADVMSPQADLVATSGVGDVEAQTPVPADGVFRIGDTTHAFLAVTALRLVEDEVLALDDTVEEHLPGLVQGGGHDGSQITVRDLLQHTSGLPDASNGRMDTPESYAQQAAEVFQPEQFVGVALGREAKFAPGEGWANTNTDSILLGMVIEAVTGNPWHEEVQAQVLDVLGLDDTVHAGTGPQLPGPHAEGYQQFGTDGPVVDVTALAHPYADGGLLSTTADLNDFFRGLVNGKVLLPRQLSAMMEDTVPATEMRQLWPQAEYGLGLTWRPLSCGGGYWSHGGDMPGYMTREGVTENARYSVVVSVSSQPGDVEGVKRQDRAVSRLIDNALCNNP